VSALLEIFILFLICKLYKNSIVVLALGGEQDFASLLFRRILKNVLTGQDTTKTRRKD